jgi:hypothetical protein
MTPSVRAMLLQLAGMVDTVDLSQWESEFLARMLELTAQATKTSGLTEKQLERIAELWKKHFAG